MLIIRAFLLEKFSGAEIQVLLQRLGGLQHQPLSRNKIYFVICLLTMQLIKDSMEKLKENLRSCTDFGRAEAHPTSVQSSLPHDHGYKEES